MQGVRGIVDSGKVLLWACFETTGATVWPQDWAQITFRSEILSNMFKNESGRWLAKEQKSESGDLSMIYRVSQSEFLLKSFTPKTLWLLILVYKVVLVKELTTN